MDDRFLTACFPGRVRVCGRLLTDFTPYHYLLLRAIESPLIQPGGANRPADLLAAISACRSRFGDAVNLKPRMRDFVWRWRMTRDPAMFRREVMRFARWMSDHSCGPRFWQVVSGGPETRDLTGPDILTLIVPMMMRTSMSESEVWNMSLGRAQWISAEIQEIDGSQRRFLYDGDLTEPEEFTDA